MNPLDPLELQHFVRNLNAEMPIHTETTAKIKRSYSQGMPKNLMEYSAYVDNRFLNDNLAIIEEMHHRDQIHPIPRWFREYQLRHYSKHGILNHDNFFKARLHDGFVKPDLSEQRWIGSKAAMNFKNVGFASLVGNTKVFGSLLEAGAGGSTPDGAPNFLRSQKTDNNGTVGQYYDQIAASIANGVGNYRMAPYNDNAGEPNALYNESGSLAAVTGYALKTLTEFALNTAVVWLSINYDNASFTQHRTPSDSFPTTDYNDRSFGYAAMPNPWGTGTATSTIKFVMKLNHS